MKNLTFLRQLACCLNTDKHVVPLILKIESINDTMSVLLAREGDPSALPKIINLPQANLGTIILDILDAQLNHTVSEADPLLRINLFQSISFPNSTALLPETSKFYACKYTEIFAELRKVAGLYDEVSPAVARNASPAPK